MKKSLVCLYALALFFVTGCGCNSTSEREDTVSLEPENNDVTADVTDTPARVYVRDISTSNVNGYHLCQDVATVIEDYYRNFTDHRFEINKDGKIKNYNGFVMRTQYSFGVDGDLLFYKHSSYDDGVLQHYESKYLDDRHRVIRRESTRTDETSPYIIQYLFEDEGDVSYATVIKTNAHSPNVPRYKYAEYDKNHRLVRQFDEGGEFLKEEWQETPCSEIEIRYESGIPVYKAVYDDKGRVTERWQRIDGALQQDEIVQYDDVNNIKTCICPNDNESYKRIYYYTEDYSQILKYYRKNRLDEITGYETYNYDIHGNIIQSVGQYDSVQYSYEYDSKGNWIVKVSNVSTDSYSPSYIYIRHIKYHDGYDSDIDLQEVLWKYVAGAVPSAGNANQGNNADNSQPAVVEHHGAVQVWIPCPVCNNSGDCQTCLGTGRSLMSGDICITCGGNKKCKFCAGQGGHYEMRTY